LNPFYFVLDGLTVIFYSLWLTAYRIVEGRGLKKKLRDGESTGKIATD